MTLLPFSDPRSFAIPIIIAFCIQAVLLVLMSTHWMNTESTMVKTVPSHIAARVVQIQKPVPKKKKQVKKQPAKKVKRTQSKAAKKAPEKKVTPKKIIKPTPKKTLPSKKKASEIKQSEKLLARERAKKEEQARIQKELAKAAALDELDALLAEENLLEEALQSEKEQAAIADYASQIRALIERVWRVPPSAKHTDTVMVRLFLVPTGEVTEVQVVESSGNIALDRSAEQAVWKVGTLPVPQDAALFEKQFRRFTLKLTPENARL